ncbi:hypothetical protein [Comamonas sp. GB3 AK4-5]|uniref:hypothetical protein n=1 Tax=Comamonas sp. GB3 AK4-5 TaxID=3231487 RepID=UPI00351F03E5
MSMPASFREWANAHTEAYHVRRRALGYGGTGGAGRWWTLLDADLRCFLLSRQAPKDWEKYMACEWHALPKALRSVLALDIRAVRRMLEDCTWH